MFCYCYDWSFINKFFSCLRIVLQKKRPQSYKSSCEILFHSPNYELIKSFESSRFVKALVQGDLLNFKTLLRLYIKKLQGSGIKNESGLWYFISEICSYFDYTVKCLIEIKYCLENEFHFTKFVTFKANCQILLKKSEKKLSLSNFVVSNQNLAVNRTITQLNLKELPCTFKNLLQLKISFQP